MSISNDKIQIEQPFSIFKESECGYMLMGEEGTVRKEADWGGGVEIKG